MACTRHRVFLATLIVAAKYLNDSSPKNKHWAAYTNLFGVAEINLMERQLLFLLDFDLRFDEEEACMQFSPFMATRAQSASTPATPEQQEARAAAVDKVSKAGKARAQATQLPPTPPNEAPINPIVASSSTLVSAVRGLARRISVSAIGGHAHVNSAEIQSSSPKSVLSTVSRSSSNISGQSSEMGSMIYDSGSSTSSDSLSERGEESDFRPATRFQLRSIPPRAYRQGRKVSDTSSINTVRGDANSSPCGPIKRALLDTKRPRNVTYGQPHRNSSDDNSLPTIARIKESVSLSSHGSGGFLSRMWGAATKTQHEKLNSDGVNSKTTDYDAPAITIVEPKESYPHMHGSSTFRRIVHSRSAVFRTGEAQH